MKLRIYQFSQTRFFGGTLFILLVCYGLTILPKYQSTLITIFAACTFAVVLSSLSEWLFHAFIYHHKFPGLEDIFEVHHVAHHYSMFPAKDYVQDDSSFQHMNITKPLKPYRLAKNVQENLRMRFSQIGLHFVIGIFFVFLPAWFLTYNSLFLSTCVGTVICISWLIAEVHGAMHTPKNRFVERTRWYKWLNHHHYIHHVDTTANLNFLLPICDHIYGSRKSALTHREASSHPSYQDAVLLPTRRAIQKQNGNTPIPLEKQVSIA